MKLVLDRWARRWPSSVIFDLTQGRGQLRWFARQRAVTEPLVGWASKHRGVWYAAWREADVSWFQAGLHRWPMTDEFRCANVRSGRERLFTVSKSGEVVFELRYKALDRDADPTFDDLDLELEDFFVWVTRLWNGEVQPWSA